MPFSHAAVAAAAFRGFGIDASPVPESDARSLALGKAASSGDECFPLTVTLGDFLRILSDGFPPQKAAFFMPTSSGPCRFGQYADYMRRVFASRGFEQAMVLSPTSENAYDGVGTGSMALLRACWRGLVVADHLVALLLLIRPYEITAGDADGALNRGLDLVCRVLQRGPHARLADLRAAASQAAALLRAVPTRAEERPLVGVVGEIFCRNNAFSNMEAIRCLERHGAECWVPPLSEWVHYTNLEERKRYLRTGASLAQWAKCLVRQAIQELDFTLLARVFHQDLRGRPEAPVARMLAKGAPYLPSESALGEMALSVARAVYLYEHGVCGVVDISPFSCMNAIVAEAVYPRVSRDCGGLPIRTFYFDGTSANLDRDVGVFMQLVRSFMARHPMRRTRGRSA